MPTTAIASLPGVQPPTTPTSLLQRFIDECPKFPPIAGNSPGRWRKKPQAKPSGLGQESLPQLPFNGLLPKPPNQVPDNVGGNVGTFPRRYHGMELTPNDNAADTAESRTSSAERMYRYVWVRMEESSGASSRWCRCKILWVHEGQETLKVDPN